MGAQPLEIAGAIERHGVIARFRVPTQIEALLAEAGEVVHAPAREVDVAQAGREMDLPNSHLAPKPALGAERKIRANPSRSFPEILGRVYDAAQYRTAPTAYAADRLRRAAKF